MEIRSSAVALQVMKRLIHIFSRRIAWKRNVTSCGQEAKITLPRLLRSAQSKGKQILLKVWEKLGNIV